ncbi:hypothetical protein AVEN_61649-1 [Araneus ventricosus]|uniref:Uncharacterized protein n=1 Tax=Araneus ventricosus TaxID=182803 RepID=A0A4Y2MXG6_ARAVE|nr:hypothetical protein AVEN_61649-1 [Araneus ventricosus]
MPFGPLNPIDTTYGQFVDNYTHPRKSLYSVPSGPIARGSGQFNGNKDRCEVNHDSLREHGMLPSTYTHATCMEPFGFRAREYTVALMLMSVRVHLSSIIQKRSKVDG